MRHSVAARTPGGIDYSLTADKNSSAKNTSAPISDQRRVNPVEGRPSQGTNATHTM